MTFVVCRGLEKNWIEEKKEQQGVQIEKETKTDRDWRKRERPTDKQTWKEIKRDSSLQ